MVHLYVAFASMLFHIQKIKQGYITTFIYHWTLSTPDRQTHCNI